MRTLSSLAKPRSALASVGGRRRTGLWFSGANSIKASCMDESTAMPTAAAEEERKRSYITLCPCRSNKGGAMDIRSTCSSPNPAATRATRTCGPRIETGANAATRIAGETTSPNQSGMTASMAGSRSADSSSAWCGDRWELSGRPAQRTHERTLCQWRALGRSSAIDARGSGGPSSQPRENRSRL